MSGDAEVQKLHAAAGEHHVGRFEVPVRDAGTMRRVERARDFGRRTHQLRERQRSALEPPLQRFALDVFHDEEVAAVLAADVVDRADMRVVERGNRARFALEPKPVLGIAAV